MGLYLNILLVRHLNYSPSRVPVLEMLEEGLLCAHHLDDVFAIEPGPFVDPFVQPVDHLVQIVQGLDVWSSSASAPKRRFSWRFR